MLQDIDLKYVGGVLTTGKMLNAAGLQVGGVAIPALDSTAADIAQVGTSAVAGAVGKGADAGHVHPAPNGYVPADVGLIAWNDDPANFQGTSASAVNGTIYLIQFVLRTSQTISKGAFGIAVAATTATANENFIALVDSTGAIRASTAAGAIDTATQSAGWFSQPFTTPYAAPAGKYWLAILLNAGTPLKFAQKTIQSGGLSDVGVTAANFRFAANGTGATALPGSFTPSSNTHTGAILLPVGVS